MYFGISLDQGCPLLSSQGGMHTMWATDVGAARCTGGWIPFPGSPPLHEQPSSPPPTSLTMQAAWFPLLSYLCCPVSIPPLCVASPTAQVAWPAPSWLL